MSGDAQQSGADSVFALIQRAAAANSWSGLADELDAMSVDALDQDGAVAWFRGRGMAAERLGNRDEALGVWEAGIARHPDSSWLQFLVGQLLEQDGRFEAARPHFASARLVDGGGALVMAAARYLYLWDAWAEAASVLDQIFDRYFELPSVDDTFLYLRKLPMFSSSFGARAAIALLAGRPLDADALLARLGGAVDDLRPENARLTLAASLGDSGPLLDDLGRAPADGQVAGLPHGYRDMRLAVWRSDTDGELNTALERLDEVALEESDFPWLKDIRLVGRARAQRRFRDEDALTRTVEAVVAQHPLLFEPEHAFYFGLLGEQEELKKLYRARRGEQRADA